MTNEPITAQSGVAFPEHPDTRVAVEATFLESGNQLQQVFIGLQPVLVVQPEYDAEEDQVTFLVTAVDLPPAGLLQVLESLKDGVEEIIRIQEEQGKEIAETLAGQHPEVGA